MTEKREVIRRLRHGQSIRQIYRDTGMHRTIIRELRLAAIHYNWLTQDAKLPGEYEIQQKLEQLKGNQESPDAPHPLDPFKDRIQQWLEDKESYVVIHQHISEEISVSEATVRRYCKRHFPDAPRASWLRPTIPGEIMEVDFGFLGIVYDPDKDRKRKAWVFSARLRHCVHRSKTDTHSGGKRTVIPLETGHLFRLKTDSFSGLPE